MKCLICRWAPTMNRLVFLFCFGAEVFLSLCNYTNENVWKFASASKQNNLYRMYHLVIVHAHSSTFLTKTVCWCRLFNIGSPLLLFFIFFSKYLFGEWFFTNKLMFGMCPSSFVSVLLWCCWKTSQLIWNHGLKTTTCRALLNAVIFFSSLNWF